MIVKQRLGLPWLFGLGFLALLVIVLRIAPAQANAGHAASTGQPCATCHYSGSAMSGTNLTAAGQNFVRCGYILNCTATAAPTSPPQYGQPQQPIFPGNPGFQTAAPFQVGNIWIVQLRESNGRFADMIWTRRGTSNVFDAIWHLEGDRFADVINYEGYRNGQITFYSPALQSRFVGAPTNDGNYIVNGTTTGANAGSGDSWTATIFGN